jgi:hypothetical protein
MGDPFLDVYRWKRQLDRHGPEILTQSPPAATCRCPRSSGRRCAFSPPPRSSTWPRPFMPATGRWCLWAPTAPADRGLAGLRPSRVDLLAGAVTVAETLTEVKGKLIAGPPKTRAGRRTVGLPPFVVRDWRHICRRRVARQPRLHRPRCGPLRVPGFRARSWVPAPRQPTCRACTSTIFATPSWRCGSPPAPRPRRSPCGGHTSVSLTLDRWGPPDDPRPVARAGAIQ